MTYRQAKYPIAVFFASRAIIGFLVYLSLLLIPVRSDPGLWWRGFPDNLFLDGLFRWDTAWYRGIVIDGYTPPAQVVEGHSRNTAFFPGYPLLMKLVALIVGDVDVAGLVISNASFLGALILLHHLVRTRHGDEDLARRATLLLAFNPFSIYFMNLYTESLFLFAVLGAFVAAQTRSWLLAGAAGFLAAGTKVLGVVIVLPLLILYLRQRGGRRGRDLLFVLAVLLAPLGYMLFLHARYGSFFEFVHAQNVEGWSADTTLASAWQILGDTVRDGRTLLAGGYDVTSILHMTYFVLTLGLVGWGLYRRLLDPAQFVWALAFLLPAFSKWTSVGRYCAVVFPVYVVLARIFARESYAVILALFVGLMTLYAIMFSHWYYVA